MPFTFVQIQEKKSRSIALAFLSILFIYFLTVYLLLLVIENSFMIYRVFFPPLYHVMTAFSVAFLAGLAHWSISTYNLTAKLMVAVGALPLDPQDTYHQVFKHIVDEVSVAIGGRRIEPVVIRSASLNAFSIDDFNRRAVIGITEGLLSRLNRAHIEAVVGHEAGHIASGDSLSTTVLASMGELYEETIARMRAMLRGSRGRGVLLILLIYIILTVTGLLSRVLRFFLSREREYRADALGVRLTRDPVSLAEALKLISRGWRGEGGAGEYLQSIFIMNPKCEDVDEAQGPYADMLSTHPPVKKRIEALLAMAHLDEKTLDEHVKDFRRISPVVKAEFSPEDAPQAKAWFVFNQGTWQGPFDIGELKGLAGLLPTSWIRPDGQEQIREAIDEPKLKELFGIQDEAQAHGACPICKVPLQRIQYEGVPVLKCSYCSGTLVESDKVCRILIRQDYIPSAEVLRLAKVMAENKEEFRLKDAGAKTVWVLTCPVCNRQMRRKFFVDSYPVEIDQCVHCSGIWFDKDELELLQYIYEHKEQFLNFLPAS